MPAAAFPVGRRRKEQWSCRRILRFGTADVVGRIREVGGGGGGVVEVVGLDDVAIVDSWRCCVNSGFACSPRSS
mgnify:CR=1 FL=1